jgi:hypothetical protein
LHQGILALISFSWTSNIVDDKTSTTPLKIFHPIPHTRSLIFGIFRWVKKGSDHTRHNKCCCSNQSFSK